MSTITIGVGGFGCRIASETTKSAENALRQQETGPPSVTSRPGKQPAPAILADVDVEHNSSFASGFLREGIAEASRVLSLVRRHSEYMSDSLESILIFHSLAGGIGSGLTCALLDALRDEFPRTPLITHTLMPSNEDICSTSRFFAPHNTILSTEHLMDVADTVLLYDNAAVSAFSRHRYGTTSATSSHGDLNRVIADAASHVNDYHHSASASDMTEALTPFPYLHFVVPSLAPASPSSAGSGSEDSRKTADSLMRDLFSSSSVGATAKTSSPHPALSSGDPTAPGRVWLALGGVFRGPSDSLQAQDIEGAAMRHMLRLGSSIAPFAQGVFPYALMTAEPETCSGLLLSNSTGAALPFKQAGLRFASAFKSKARLHVLEAEGITREDLKHGYERCSELVGMHQDFE